jgi:uncharacterized protein YecE (DUF72 family)
VAGRLYVGTSGYSYIEWRGTFYPDHLPTAGMMSYYSERLGAVEINGSFYRTPPETTLTGWAEKALPGFRFCLKAHRGITYSAAAFDKTGLASDFARRIAPLGDRVGPVLLQFPPTARFDAGLLDRVLGALDVPAAVEFRNEGWFDSAIYEVLRRRGAALVVTDQEKWPRAPEMEGPLGYYRLRRDYTDSDLASWLVELRAALARRDEVYVFFRHDVEAPARALHVVEALAG